MSSTETGTGSGKRRQLGRGLSSLLGDDDEDVAQLDRLRQSRTIPVDRIVPGAAQPRRSFGEAELEALTQSIRERGVLQPILLRRLEAEGERFEIIAGERRWRAAQRAQLHEIPALVREFDDTEALEIALIENIQRSDLTPLEEAEGYQRLMDEYGHTQDAIAQAVGKSRSHVANTLRLLALPAGAREHLEAGRLSAGHARALLATSDADRLADYVVAGGLSVRATERLVQSQSGAPKRPSPASDEAKPTRPKVTKDADTRALEASLTETLGLAVEITPRGDERGALTIHYQTLEQLDDVLVRLTAAQEMSGPNPLISGGHPADMGDDEQDPDAAAVAGAEEADATEEDDDSTASNTVDFDALLAETEALLTSGAFAEDAEQDQFSPAPEQADGPDGATDAERSGLLDALLDVADDAADPAPTSPGEENSGVPRDPGTDDTRERRDAPAKTETPAILDDDEIAFIDD